jgi:hypothetical protein
MEGETASKTPSKHTLWYSLNIMHIIHSFSFSTNKLEIILQSIDSILCSWVVSMCKIIYKGPVWKPSNVSLMYHEPFVLSPDGWIESCTTNRTCRVISKLPTFLHRVRIQPATSKTSITVDEGQKGLLSCISLKLFYQLVCSMHETGCLPSSQLTTKTELPYLYVWLYKITVFNPHNGQSLKNNGEVMKKL